jgi:prophage DNA circulation protein
MAEACYQDPYLPGSYKAVPFKVEMANSKHGRRGAEGEFPFGETTGYADLGRRIRRYSVTARFDGNDHVLQAAALIAVCELPGPGPLVHPTRGVILSAACVNLTVTDKPEANGGVTEVEMEFVEADNWPNGMSLVGQFLGLAIAPLITQSRSSFRSAYNPQAVPTFREEAVVGAAQGQVAAITKAYAAATQSDATRDERNRIIYDLRSVVNIDSEAEVADTMDRALSLGMAAVAQNTSGEAKFTTFRSLANGAAKTSGFGQTSAMVENAVYSHVRTVAAAYMAEGAMEATGLGATQIFGMVDVVNAVIEGELQYAREICDNRLFLELSKFRDETTSQLYQKAYESPGLAEFNFGGSVHPLTAAYAIYGDAKRHRDIEEMNVMGRFGRVSGGVAGAV